MGFFRSSELRRLGFVGFADASALGGTDADAENAAALVPTGATTLGGAGAEADALSVEFMCPASARKADKSGADDTTGLNATQISRARGRTIVGDRSRPLGAQSGHIPR